RGRALDARRVEPPPEPRFVARYARLLRPRSSGDRAAASGAVRAGSNPAGGASEENSAAPGRVELVTHAGYNALAADVRAPHCGPVVEHVALDSCGRDRLGRVAAGGDRAVVPYAYVGAVARRREDDGALRREARVVDRDSRIAGDRDVLPVRKTCAPGCRC